MTDLHYELSTERLKEIIKLADKLGWFKPPNKTLHPLMQLSEVEKCMICMFDDNYLERLRRWADEPPQPKIRGVKEWLR